jgi:4-amino-4-deoxy-L-arabinose transferase-like glycosyltransferase
LQIAISPASLLDEKLGTASKIVTEQQAQKWYPAILTALGLLLFFPGLGSFGFWDPYEIRVADAARMVTTANHWAWGPQLGRPPAPVWMVAAGFKAFGMSELGGRLPIAIASLLTLLALYYAGAAVMRKRAAFIAAAALATCPGFLLGARQLTSTTLVLLGATLAFGGLVRAAWPSPSTSAGRRILDLILGLAGLALAHLTAGTLATVLPTVLAVALAVMLSGGPIGVTAVGLLGSVVAIVYVAMAWRVTAYSSVLGGVPHALGSGAVVTTHLKPLGFALFPWIALAPLGGARALAHAGANENEAEKMRARFGALAVIAWLACLFVGGTLQSAGVTDLAVPLAPGVLLLVGLYLDELLDAAEPLPFAGMVAALGAIILGRDFFLFPESYVGAHITETIRWPGPLTQVPYVVMAYSAFWAGVVGLGLGVRLAPVGAPEAQQRRGRLYLIGGAGLAAIAMSVATIAWIVPSVSKHLSVRDVYGKTAKLDPNAPIGQYRFNATGASYYAGSKPATTLMTLPA